MMVHGKLAIPRVLPPGAVLAAGAALGLVACGSVAATGAGHRAAAGTATASAAAVRASAGVPLCTASRRLVQLEVRLTASQPREILPRALTTTDASRVRALASALCHLPPLPRGTALPGRAARRTTARVRGAGTLHHGPHPGRGLCQRYRARPSPAVVLVVAARPAAGRDGRWPRQAGSEHAPEQRAHGVVTLAGPDGTATASPAAAVPVPRLSEPGRSPHPAGHGLAMFPLLKRLMITTGLNPVFGKSGLQLGGRIRSWSCRRSRSSCSAGTCRPPARRTTRCASSSSRTGRTSRRAAG